VVRNRIIQAAAVPGVCQLEQRVRATDCLVQRHSRHVRPRVRRLQIYKSLFFDQSPSIPNGALCNCVAPNEFAACYHALIHRCGPACQHQQRYRRSEPRQLSARLRRTANRGAGWGSSTKYPRMNTTKRMCQCTRRWPDVCSEGWLLQVVMMVPRHPNVQREFAASRRSNFGRQREKVLTVSCRPSSQGPSSPILP
jgi:hypothetical protein